MMKSLAHLHVNKLLIAGIALGVLVLASGCGDGNPEVASQGGESAQVREVLRVAVAANFALVAEELAERYETENPQTAIELITGSTGLLYGQIVNGAPFDIFLAADEARPQRLIDEGLALPESRITYAIGQLVLWSPDEDLIDSSGQVLARDQFEHLAIANPELAPYGLAARQVLQRFGLWDGLQGKLVRGENIAQAFQFVSSGNAELGFIARSQLPDRGSHWVVPPDTYSPIAQQGVILSSTDQLERAQSFMRFLQEVETRQIIESFGYSTTEL